MNFFGHATVASWTRDAPAFVLGAMLPDFLSMSRARRVQIEHAVLAEGVAHHHAVDAVFHRAPTFLSLTRAAMDELTADGVGRGPSRAAAHVGIELLLDGLLADDERARAAYLSALAARGESRSLRFAEPAALCRYEALLDRLSAAGIPADLADPAAAALRLTRALRDRPRLALDPHAQRSVGRWLPRAKIALAGVRERLVSEVARGLLEKSPPS